MKTYIKTCHQCGVVFNANWYNVKICSEECKTERMRENSKKHYEANKDEHNARARKWERENRERANEAQRIRQAPAHAATKEEAKRLRPILDSLEFTPDNIPRIAIMIDYIDSEPRLAFLLDWFWLSDAKEYLDEHN